METFKDKTYKIGNAKITRVTETLLMALTPEKLFADWDETVLDEYSRWLVLGHRQEKRRNVILSVHTWVIELDGIIILVDTGIGNDKIRPFSQMFHQLHTPYLVRLEAAGVKPEQVNHILLTHLHTDHVGWNTRLMDGQWVPTFPNATYVFPDEERGFFMTPKGEARRMVFEDSVLPVIERARTVAIGPEGGGYLDVFTFHPTPGHSPGHMSISMRTGAEDVMFTGDVAHNPVQICRPEWVSVFCDEAERSCVSRKRLLDYAADRGALLFTAHFPETSVGIVKRKDSGFTWEYA